MEWGRAEISSSISSNLNLFYGKVIEITGVLFSFEGSREAVNIGPTYRFCGLIQVFFQIFRNFKS